MICSSGNALMESSVKNRNLPGIWEDLLGDLYSLQVWRIVQWSQRKQLFYLLFYLFVYDNCVRKGSASMHHAMPDCCNFFGIPDHAVLQIHQIFGNFFKGYGMIFYRHFFGSRETLRIIMHLSRFLPDTF